MGKAAQSGNCPANSSAPTRHNRRRIETAGHPASQQLGPVSSDRAALERNFHEQFEAPNRVHLTDGEFARLLDDIGTPDVFTTAKTLRSINAFTHRELVEIEKTVAAAKDKHTTLS